MVRNTLQAMLCLFCLLWSRIIVGKGCNDKRKSGGVFWEGGLLMSVVDIAYVNLYLMIFYVGLFNDKRRGWGVF